MKRHTDQQNRGPRFRILCSTVCAIALLSVIDSRKAHAGWWVDVTTNGTISSGTDSGNLLGLGTNLAGDNYTLSVLFPAPSTNYYSNPGVSASDIFNTGLPATVSFTINGVSLVTQLTSNYGSTLLEDLTDLTTSLSGIDANAYTVSINQSITTASNFTNSPDLQTIGSYTLGGSDTGSDTYNWSNADSSKTISFSGNTTSVSIAVPEPASLSRFGLGMLGAGFLRRRRQG